MIENYLGPPVSFALFLSGLCLGWRLSRLKVGEIETDVSIKGVYVGASKPLRLCAGAFGVALVGGLLVFLAGRLEFILMAYIGVAVVATSIGVVWGMGIRGWLDLLRKRPS
jgi:hypothetical protein